VSCLCSMFSLVFLHFFLYGCNILAWRKTRINYSFIFELAPTKELKYRDIFLICTMAMSVVIGVTFLHLTLLTKGYSYAKVQDIPGLLLLVNMFIIYCHIQSNTWCNLSWKIYIVTARAGLLINTSVPLQHHIPIKPLPFPLCDKKHNFVTPLQGSVSHYHRCRVMSSGTTHSSTSCPKSEKKFNGKIEQKQLLLWR